MCEIPKTYKQAFSQGLREGLEWTWFHIAYSIQWIIVGLAIGVWIGRAT